jgi:hypothetical protein
MSKPSQTVLQSKVDQIGADSWSHDRRHRYPAETRELAGELALELDGNAAAVGRALQAQHGLKVQPETLRRWTRETMAAAAPPSTRDLSHRTLALLSLEMRRLEQLPASKLDLARLAAVAQILKTLDGLKTDKAPSRATRTLADLNAEQTPADLKALHEATR